MKLMASMYRRRGAWVSPWAAFVLLCAVPAAAWARQAVQAARPTPVRTLLMAHYMPWFAAKPFSKQWGWHWTMNHFDPDIQTRGRRNAASYDYPLIGLYDSGDPDTLTCQALLMKIAGIDGVIFDWYGNDDYYDYGAVNENTRRMIPLLEQAGMRFAVCYETQTITTEIAGGVFPRSDAVSHGKRLMRWMQDNFFASPSYLKQGDQPVLISFGDPFYNDAEWNEILDVAQPRPLYLTETNRRVATASVGGFDWPQPSGGTAGALKEQDEFYRASKSWPSFMPAAYPRFRDIYADAGIGKSFRVIDDREGRTYEDSLTRALKSRASVVQLVTWNDWGEGTQIEPSVEFGYRDLEKTQRFRREILGETKAVYTTSDLRLPVAWYILRKKYVADPAALAKLATFPPLILAGRTREARALLDSFGK